MVHASTAHQCCVEILHISCQVVDIELQVPVNLLVNVGSMRTLTFGREVKRWLAVSYDLV